MMETFVSLADEERNILQALGPDGEQSNPAIKMRVELFDDRLGIEGVQFVGQSWVSGSSRAGMVRACARMSGRESSGCCFGEAASSRATPSSFSSVICAVGPR